jgi:hypothetical protein
MESEDLMKTSIRQFSRETNHGRIDYAVIRFHQYGHRRIFVLNDRGAVARATNKGWCAISTAQALNRPGFKRYCFAEHGGPATYGHTDFIVKREG